MAKHPESLFVHTADERSVQCYYLRLVCALGSLTDPISKKIREESV